MLPDSESGRAYVGVLPAGFLSDSLRKRCAHKPANLDLDHLEAYDKGVDHLKTTSHARLFTLSRPGVDVAYSFVSPFAHLFVPALYVVTSDQPVTLRPARTAPG